jgi:xanthine dehydrogenase accessory factor
MIVRTRGSTPQDRGAAMLVLQDGNTLGTLGGGCVEAEVRVRAQRLMGESHSRLLTFRLDHDYGWDDGLVCGGVMDVAVQIINSPQSLVGLEEILQAVGAGREATLVMEVLDEQMQPARFELPVLPAPKLVIAGAGHVGQALAEMAGRAGFQITVIDDRPDYAEAARFPDARCIVGDIEQELSRLAIDRFTFVVIVTRGHKHDAQALGAVIDSPACYVGLIGSKRKIHDIFESLHSQGVLPEKLANVHAPIGLEIGAVTPAEIAVSILAEMIAVRRGCTDSSAAPMKVPSAQLKSWLKS